MEQGICGSGRPDSCHPFAGPVDWDWPEVAGVSGRTGPSEVWEKAARKDLRFVGRWPEGTVEAGSASQEFLGA